MRNKKTKNNQKNNKNLKNENKKTRKISKKISKIFTKKEKIPLKDTKKEKQFNKIIKKEIFDEEKIKDEIKDIYLRSEDIYYSDLEEETENDKDNNFLTEEEFQKETKHNDDITCKCYNDEFCDSIIDDDINDDTSDDLRFQYHKKMMHLLEEDDIDNNINLKYNNKENNEFILPVEEKSWSDDPKKLKFNTGDIVVFKNNKNGPTYKVCYPSQKENFYVIKESGTLFEREVFGDLLEKAPLKNNNWISYWNTQPVIPAPKNFKRPDFLK